MYQNAKDINHSMIVSDIDQSALNVNRYGTTVTGQKAMFYIVLQRELCALLISFAQMTSLNAHLL